ncbi:RNA polymerase II mediator complex subunit [Arachnomyces sp. PD_36]|nr:RNA polymerase II mediator complex subunit [Arachnomyces sp. PD_36]
MADILTQLQTCLDQLATQFYATLCYLSTYNDHSPAIPPPNIPNALHQIAKIDKNPPPTNTTTANPADPNQQQQQQQQQQPPPLPRPDSPTTFSHRQRELARDLIIKEQQIEYLISVLPGIGSSEAEQEARIKELEKEVRDVEVERREKRRELRRLKGRLDEVLGAVGRGMGNGMGNGTGGETPRAQVNGER